MSGFPKLDVRLAEWDRFRGAVIIPCGKNHVAITLEALEGWCNQTLSSEQAVEVAAEEGALLRAVANATPAVDGVIMITNGVLNSRSWSVEDYDDGPEDSGPVYLDQQLAEREDYS